MDSWAQLRRRLQAGGGRVASFGPHTVALDYGDAAAEYAALESSGGVCDRADRATLRLTGADRGPWLHNLTTHQVKGLSPGQGRYAFACNVKGRILFDLNVLVDEEALWVDLDVRFLEPAKAHFDKYTIVEEVKVIDESAAFVRLAVVGRRGVAALKAVCGVTPNDELAIVKTTFQEARVLLFRNAFCGVDAVEIVVPAADAPALWNALCRTAHGPLAPVGRRALDFRRIEAGIPWPVSELNDEVLPAETSQLHRAVSFTKGCYLGQEVVERMRAHGSLARRLVGLAFADAEPAAVPQRIDREGRTVGTLTSSCVSPRLGAAIGLGYVRVADAAAGTPVTLGGRHAIVQALPFVAP